jgi:hypothetical protein
MPEIEFIPIELLRLEHIRYGEARFRDTQFVSPFVNRIYQDIAELTSQCIGCIEYDHQSHLLSDEEYRKRFQKCNACTRGKKDLFQEKKR